MRLIVTKDVSHNTNPDYACLLVQFDGHDANFYTSKMNWMPKHSEILDILRAPTIPEGVFQSGPSPVIRRQVVMARIEDSAQKVLGRPLSDQGRKDVGDGGVIAFYLGARVA